MLFRAEVSPTDLNCYPSLQNRVGHVHHTRHLTFLDHLQQAPYYLGV